MLYNNCNAYTFKITNGIINGVKNINTYDFNTTITKKQITMLLLPSNTNA